MKWLMLMAVVLLIGFAGCRTDRPPEHKMIERAFFKCEKCQSVEGGIYGKGPFKSLHSPEAKACVHDWQAISMAEFRSLGTKWRGTDWTKEIPFWNPETNGIPNNTSEGIRQPAGRGTETSRSGDESLVGGFSSQGGPVWGDPFYHQLLKEWQREAPTEEQCPWVSGVNQITVGMPRVKAELQLPTNANWTCYYASAGFRSDVWGVGRPPQWEIILSFRDSASDGRTLARTEQSVETPPVIKPASSCPARQVYGGDSITNRTGPKAADQQGCSTASSEGTPSEGP